MICAICWRSRFSGRTGEETRRLDFDAERIRASMEYGAGIRCRSNLFDGYALMATAPHPMTAGIIAQFVPNEWAWHAARSTKGIEISILFILRFRKETCASQVEINRPRAP